MTPPPEKPKDEVFQRLEEEYAETHLISVIQRGGMNPAVEWDEALSTNDVIANLFKALLSMTLDEYIIEMMENMADEEDGEEEGDGE